MSQSADQQRWGGSPRWVCPSRFLLTSLAGDGKVVALTNNSWFVMKQNYITESPADITSDQRDAAQDHINTQRALLSLPANLGTAITADPKASHAMDELIEGYLAHRTGLELPGRVASAQTPHELAEAGARGLVRALGERKDRKWSATSRRMWTTRSTWLAGQEFFGGDQRVRLSVLLLTMTPPQPPLSSVLRADPGPLPPAGTVASSRNPQES